MCTMLHAQTILASFLKARFKLLLTPGMNVHGNFRCLKDLHMIYCKSMFMHFLKS